MTLNRYANRKDSNEDEIVAALKAIGCTVMYGKQVDLIVGYDYGERGKRNYLMEIKTAKGKLKPSQEALLRVWKGQYSIVRTVQEAIDIVLEKA